MKSVITAGMMGVLMVGALAKSDLTKIPLCTANGTQEDPAMSGWTAVWADQRNGSENSDIYGYLFSEPNELAICTAQGHQTKPAVSGSYVVWQDERNGNSDIYGYNLTLREEFAICLNSFEQQYPDISGAGCLAG